MSVGAFTSWGLAYFAFASLQEPGELVLAP
jgi:hypothetical protein